MTQFTIDGESVELPSTPIVVGGETYDLPVMNLQVSRYVSKHLLPAMMSIDGSPGNWDEWAEHLVNAVAMRFASIDGMRHLTALCINTRLLSTEQSAFFKATEEWLYQSGILKKAGETAGEVQPGEAAQQPPAT